MNGVRWSGAQCFVAGVPACSLLVSEVEGTIQIRMRADEPSRARRTLYTITAPSVSGPAWYWFSHVWIRPESAR